MYLGKYSSFHFSIIHILQFCIKLEVLCGNMKTLLLQQSPSSNQSKNGYRPITCSKITIDIRITDENVPNSRLVCIILGDLKVNEIPELGISEFGSELFSNTDILEIITTGSEPNDAWILNDHTMFHHFSSLKNLRLGITPLISPKYDAQDKKNQLLNELFNLPNLKSIQLENWNHGDSFMWKFPKNIEQLILRKCDYTTFDLSSYSSLRFIEISFARLKKMPQLPSPPLPLQTLWLFGMPSLEFSILEIVHFCALNNLRVFQDDYDGSNYNTKRYCECVRGLKYAIKYEFLERKFECNPDTIKTFSKNCKDYPYEEAIRKREQFCEDVVTTTLPPENLITFPPLPSSSRESAGSMKTNDTAPKKCAKKSCKVFAILSVLLLLVIFVIALGIFVARKIFLQRQND